MLGNSLETAGRHFITALTSALFIFGLSSQPALAHKGHAGPPVQFMELKEALKGMLPVNAKVLKRKEELNKDAAGWAKQKYGVEPPTGILTYFVARNEAGQTLGAAYITNTHYRHGDIAVVVGIDAEGRITQAALLNANEKYVGDFAATVGTGFMARFAGLKAEELATQSDDGNEAAKAVIEQVRTAVAVLAALTQTGH